MNGQNRVAVISGGSRGLGAALVSGFHARGYRVATLSRSPTPFIEELAKNRKHHDDFFWSGIDGRDHDAVRDFIKDTIARFGRIDALVNNAGIAADGVLATMSTQDIVDCVDVNLTATLMLSQVCSRAMLRQGSGSIVNVSSVNGLRGHHGVSVYSATKAALDGFTRSLARELGPRNIRVNSVAPGYFESDLVRGINAEDKQRIVRRTPLGRLAELEDIANAIFFLTSSEARFITGQIIAVDGGLTC